MKNVIEMRFHAGFGSIWKLEEIFIDAFQTRTYTTTAAFEQHVETTYMLNMAIHSAKLTITIYNIGT